MGSELAFSSWIEFPLMRIIPGSIVNSNVLFFFMAVFLSWAQLIGQIKPDIIFNKKPIIPKKQTTLFEYRFFVRFF